MYTTVINSYEQNMVLAGNNRRAGKKLNKFALHS
jgi:hypothetical protein